MSMDLSKIFGQFAGREISITEVPEKIELKELGITHEHIRLELTNKPDPVIADLKDTVEKNGLQLRLWFPGSIGTMDYRTNRLNAYVEKEADGKYRIQNKFHIG